MKRLCDLELGGVGVPGDRAGRRAHGAAGRGGDLGPSLRRRLAAVVRDGGADDLLLSGLGPPDADTLLISPPITDGRRLRGVRAEVEQRMGLLATVGRAA
jgi:hypothetical protein